MKRIEYPTTLLPKSNLDKFTKQLLSIKKDTNSAFELLRRLNKPAIHRPVGPIRAFPQYHPDLLRGKRFFEQLRPKPTQLEQFAELIRNPPKRREVFVNNPVRPYIILF